MKAKEVARRGAVESPPAVRAIEPWEVGPPPGLFDEEAPSVEPPEMGRDQTKDAEKIIGAILGSVELFHDPKQNAYARARVGARRVALKLRSHSMRIWIARAAREFMGKSVTAAAIDEALIVLEGTARFEREMRSVFVRVASHNGAICVDLGDDTGACIVVTPEDWTVVDDSPVMFRRPDSMRPLPRPALGGTLDDLRPFVNLAGESFLLFVAWLVAALRPDRPFPILALHGEQGTAKSTATRVARALIDPNSAPVRAAPRKEDDLAVAALHSHVVAFDNLSGLQPWLSDALCRLATGGGLSKRTLYTDDEETVLDAVRPVIVNGIEDLANRADLAERALMLTLQPLSKGKRRDEESFWRDFNRASPRILGVLLDGVSAALRRLPTVHPGDLPRMADFAKWIEAAEPGLGLPGGTLRAAYDRNRASVVEAALGSSQIATAVRALIEERNRREGTPAEMLQALSAKVSQRTQRDQSWPANPRALSQALTRNATFLRTIDIEMELTGYAGRGSDKRRIYRVWRPVRPGEIVPTDPASPEADSLDDSGGRRFNGARPYQDSDTPQAATADVGTQRDRAPATPVPRENECWGRGVGGDDPAGQTTDKPLATKERRA